MKQRFDGMSEGLKLTRSLMYIPVALSVVIAAASLIRGSSVVAVLVSLVATNTILLFGIWAINRELRRRNASTSSESGMCGT